MKPKQTEGEVHITEIDQTQMRFCVVGTRPLLPHAMSFKARGQLTLPPKKKNQAEKETSMKHEPYEEFRDAAYMFTDDEDMPTRLYMPGSCFHASMTKVAVDMAGARKSQIGRLTSILEEKVCIWGVPQIISLVVRSSDMARTPDTRFLPCLTRWCCTFTVEFVSSLIKPASVGNLLGGAGKINGIGDGRPEKGKLNFGRFRVCSENDPEFLAVQKHGGLKFQDAAMKDPTAYDLETKRLLEWFNVEVERRHAAPAISMPRGKVGNGKRAEAHTQ